ncbi:MAG: carbon-nitrogen hydrolase [Gammaproteobacteria bacterium]|nr:MAG: carbon-nitrogen hydrolase [Pseudomonadota bacterium]PIE38195.1 MAG: carbon-nitrogen hydrolase [Gammaproteobacteria bacterium]
MSATMFSVIQMVSSQDVSSNLEQTRELVQQAADQGARLVVLPENFAILDSENLRAAAEEEQASRRIRSALTEIARECKVWVVAGTLPEVSRPDGHPVPNGRVRAACHLVDDQGEWVARYDKIHLFDVEVGDRTGVYRESARIEPGEEVVVVKTPFGRLGLAVCYDLRFAEQFLLMAKKGVEIVALPAAFTYRTGQAHWDTLVRARAIEFQAIMLASNQGGVHSPARETWGHSMIVDAWGVVSGMIPQGSGILNARLAVARIAEIRKKMPIADHRVLPSG